MIITHLIILTSPSLLYLYLLYLYYIGGPYHSHKYFIKILYNFHDQYSKSYIAKGLLIKIRRPFAVNVLYFFLLLSIPSPTKLPPNKANTIIGSPPVVGNGSASGTGTSKISSSATCPLSSGTVSSSISSSIS